MSKILSFCATKTSSLSLVPIKVDHSTQIDIIGPKIGFVLLILPIISIYAIILVIVYLRLRRQLKINRQKAIDILKERVPSIYLIITFKENIWQIDNERIIVHFNEIIGSGSEGVIYRGLWAMLRIVYTP